MSARPPTSSGDRNISPLSPQSNLAQPQKTAVPQPLNIPSTTLLTSDELTTNPIEQGITPEDVTISPRRRDAKRHRYLREARAEGRYILDHLKRLSLKPGVAGGLFGLVNMGCLAIVGEAFLRQPTLRRDTPLLGIFGGAVALLSLESYAVTSICEVNLQGNPTNAAAHAPRRESKIVGFRGTVPKLLRGAVGCVNIATLAALGYISYTHWDRPVWSKRVLSGVALGLLTLVGSEGLLVESLAS